MTAPDRNARVTDRNEVADMAGTSGGWGRNLMARLRAGACDNPCNVTVCACSVMEEAANALAAMTADRDRWRALAENTHPGKGRS